MNTMEFNTYQDNKTIAGRDISTHITHRILENIFKYRRVLHSTQVCEDLKCLKCTSPHFSKIITSVRKNKPIYFVLPAFPGKSPNTEKVLGHLPDKAEVLSLQFLKSLCDQIKAYYKPGIKIIICSDGRVFSDIISMKEENVTAYQIAIQEIIDNLLSEDISTFNLDDYYHNINFNQMREQLMDDYGKSREKLQEKIKNGGKDSATLEEKEANQMYKGMTRFLFEDSLHHRQTKSRSLIQKESRLKAYEVIRRSNAWTDLIALRFPEAVRLSIHPQTCGSKKLGIRLIADESWMTPWHGVAVKRNNSFFLLKRFEAEELGAKLIYKNGHPSYFEIKQNIDSYHE